MLVAEDTEDPKKVCTTWSCWRAYSDSANFQALLNYYLL